MTGVQTCALPIFNEEMRRKGKQLGADEQLSKPEIGRLVEVMDELLDRREMDF